MVTITPHTTRATGTILTAAIYNGDHQNHITNANSLASVVNAIPVISSYGADLIDSADASAALTTLGVSTFAKTLLDDADAVAARSTLSLPWEIIYDNTFSAVTEVQFLNLSAYRQLRFNLYAHSDTVTSGAGWQFSSNNGSSWIGAANDYRVNLIYQDEGTTSATAFQSTTQTNFNSIRTMQIGATPNLGLHWNAQINELNKNNHKTIMGDIYVYNGSLVLFAHYTGRSASANTLPAMNALRLLSSQNMSGYLLLEGKRG